MSKVKFFRIHHSSDITQGCYRAGCTNNLLSYYAYSTNWKKHPPPYEDSKLYQSLLNSPDYDGFDYENLLIKYHFGFTSLEQLKAWFYNEDWLEWLDEQGFILSEFECDDVPEMFIAGNSQAIAKLDCAIQLKTISLLELIG